MKSINVEAGFCFCGGWILSKSVIVDSTFIREMRVIVCVEEFQDDVGTLIHIETMACKRRNVNNFLSKNKPFKKVVK